MPNSTYIIIQADLLRSRDLYTNNVIGVFTSNAKEGFRARPVYDKNSEIMDELGESKIYFNSLVLGGSIQ